jgi:hypothetical protein
MAFFRVFEMTNGKLGLSLALMYLCRIKNPEQLKHTSPGEFGKLLGLDRIPEAKNLRKKISQIVTQQKA